MKTLVAEDDDKDLLRLTETILRANGHRVIKAVDASQALPSAQREKPDLILPDINMSGGDGRDIPQNLKRSILTSGIQVIVISGDRDPALREFVTQGGAEGFLLKSWTLENFIQDLRKLCPHLPW